MTDWGLLEPTRWLVFELRPTDPKILTNLVHIESPCRRRFQCGAFFFFREIESSVAKKSKKKKKILINSIFFFPTMVSKVFLLGVVKSLHCVAKGYWLSQNLVLIGHQTSPKVVSLNGKLPQKLHSKSTFFSRNCFHLFLSFVIAL